MSNKKPNILIFMTDQEQAQVTLPGHPCQTPNLDQLARRGVRFTSAYPPMAHCCPARASFMTGLFPSQHGIWNNVLNDQVINSSIYPGVEMFSEKLEESGYQLFYGGKWHVSMNETPRDRGWNELQPYETGTQDGGSRREMYRKLPNEFEQRDRKKGEVLRPGWRGFQLYGTSHQSLEDLEDYKNVSRAIHQIEQFQDGDDPWCMFIGTIGPHDPFKVPEPYASMYDPEDIPLPPNYFDTLEDKPGIYRRMSKAFSQLTEQEIKESRAHYWGYCTMMDDLLGRVLKALEASGDLEDTLILFVSDHGELGGAHGLHLKGIPAFDEGYRVPLVISSLKWVQSPGREVDELVSLMDIAPTLLELAEAEPLDRCAGKSLVPYLKNNNNVSWRDSLYFQCNGTELYYISRTVKTKKYKFVYHPSDIDELYDLEKDPHELDNLADDPNMAAVKKSMYTKMWKHAFQSEDQNFVTYPTVTLGDYGPGILNESIEND